MSYDRHAQFFKKEFVISDQFTRAILEQADKQCKDDKEKRAFILGAHVAFGFFSFDLAKLDNIKRVIMAAPQPKKTILETVK